MFFLLSSAIYLSTFQFNPSITVTMRFQYTPELLYPLDVIQISPGFLLILRTNFRENCNLLALF